MDKKTVWLGAAIGSVVGSMVPLLFGVNAFSPVCVLTGGLGGLAGIWAVWQLF